MSPLSSSTEKRIFFQNSLNFPTLYKKQFGLNKQLYFPLNHKDKTTLLFLQMKTEEEGKEKERDNRDR